MAGRRPDEITVLRRLVAAQDEVLLAYRTSMRTPSKATDEIARCKRWLEQIRRDAGKPSR